MEGEMCNLPAKQVLNFGALRVSCFLKRWHLKDASSQSSAVAVQIFPVWKNWCKQAVPTLELLILHLQNVLYLHHLYTVLVQDEILFGTLYLTVSSLNACNSTVIYLGPSSDTATKIFAFSLIYFCRCHYEKKTEFIFIFCLFP